MFCAFACLGWGWSGRAGCGGGGLCSGGCPDLISCFRATQSNQCYFGRERRKLAAKAALTAQFRRSAALSSGDEPPGTRPKKILRKIHTSRGFGKVSCRNPCPNSKPPVVGQEKASATNPHRKSKPPGVGPQGLGRGPDACNPERICFLGSQKIFTHRLTSAMSFKAKLRATRGAPSLRPPFDGL